VVEERRRRDMKEGARVESRGRKQEDRGGRGGKEREAEGRRRDEERRGRCGEKTEGMRRKTSTEEEEKGRGGHRDEKKTSKIKMDCRNLEIPRGIQKRIGDDQLYQKISGSIKKPVAVQKAVLKKN
jgi:hypothetical protein